MINKGKSIFPILNYQLSILNSLCLLTYELKPYFLLLINYYFYPLRRISRCAGFPILRNRAKDLWSALTANCFIRLLNLFRRTTLEDTNYHPLKKINAIDGRRTFVRCFALWIFIHFSPKESYGKAHRLKTSDKNSFVEFMDKRNHYLTK